jgi:putative oxidoreductase
MTPADTAGVFIFPMRMSAHKTRENLKLSAWIIRNSYIAITLKEMAMTNLNSSLHVVARVFLGLLFLVAGLGKLGNVDGFAGYMASGGIPAFLAWPAVLFEILAGAAIIAGFQTRLAALALAAFCVVTAVLYHFVPADQMQITQFFKKLGLAGGYLLLAQCKERRIQCGCQKGVRPSLPTKEALQ